jgi:hypothetical protein
MANRKVNIWKSKHVQKIAAVHLSSLYRTEGTRDQREKRVEVGRESR